MDTTVVIVAGIIAIVVLVLLFLYRDRLSELSVNGRETTIQAKMQNKAQTEEELRDDKPVSVTFKGNKLRGEGQYRMRDADFSDNDVDGKQNLDLGYDEPSDADQPEQNQ
ncbi:MAG: hypothetical protein DCF21_03830 [Leptolyngbya sp.]|jgi:uncharacterized membrane protein YdfJ with MMPL/SSD domain|uniref:Uncharacterized protein n=1 Tax=Shackletoniella antarctica TaxID=268115 RepID=A0A2W4WCP6_9CYAN|nr:MAG: hypothetical protein DCF17_07710 [Shackletoniella antarctica]PZV20833.1 MAG: hypothetical protein DCF21_03830 [Leptolyngbya sp.]